MLFSDSRQDAAKLSAGFEKRHYQDVVRQLILEALERAFAGTTLSCSTVSRQEGASTEGKGRLAAFPQPLPGRSTRHLAACLMGLPARLKQPGGRGRVPDAPATLEGLIGGVGTACLRFGHQSRRAGLDASGLSPPCRRTAAMDDALPAAGRRARGKEGGRGSRAGSAATPPGDHGVAADANVCRRSTAALARDFESIGSRGRLLIPQGSCTRATGPDDAVRRRSRRRSVSSATCGGSRAHAGACRLPPARLRKYWEAVADRHGLESGGLQSCGRAGHGRCC